MKAVARGLFIAALAVAIVGPLMSPRRAVSLGLQATGDAHNYLPVIHKPLPTPTPTVSSSPPPVPTPRPPLQDGYYEASFSNGGAIWFTVKNNGTVATDAGFDFKRVSVPWCGWQFNLFDGSENIVDGHFGFLELGYDYFPEASLECESLSTTSASCRAADMTGDDICAWINATAERQ